MLNLTGLSEKKTIINKSIKEILQKYELAYTLSLTCEKYYADLLIGNDYYADIV